MFRIICLTVFLILNVPLAFADAQTDVENLTAFRGFKAQSFIYDVRMHSFRNGAPLRAPQVGRIYFKDHKQILINFTAPERTKGRRILFEDKRMWLSLPKSARSIRITAQDKLLGEASIADVLNINIVLYKHSYGASEIVNGVNYKRLILESTSKKNAYARIEFLARQMDNRPFMGFFYARSGKLLKVAEYSDFLESNGRSFVARMVLTDPIFNDRETVVDFYNYQLKILPPEMFRASAIRNPLKY